MRKSKCGLFPERVATLFKRYAHLGKIGLLSLLALLLALGPIWSGTAGAQLAGQPEQTLGLRATVGTIFASAGDFIRGEQADGRVLPEKDLSAVLASLEQFSQTVLRDPRLAEIIDAIIEELITAEGLPGGIQDNKEFVAEIIRDPRLIAAVGEIIADFLLDERLAGDIEAIAGTIADLITYQDLHYFIRDSIATLLEDRSLERMMNDLLLTGTGLIYDTGSDTVASLLGDKRIPGLLKGFTPVVTGAVSEMASFIDQNNGEMLLLAEEMVLIFADYGVGLPANLLEDPRLNSCLAGITERMLRPGLYQAAASMGFELSGHLLEVGFESVARQVKAKENAIKTLAGGLVQDFFKADGAVAQKYFQGAMTEVIDRGREAAAEATPADRTVMVIADAEIQKKIADAVATVPPQMAKLAAFTWLLGDTVDPPYSQTPVDPVPRTYRAWVEDVVGVVVDLFDNNAGELAVAMNKDLEKIVRGFLGENESEISEELVKVIRGLPLDSAAAELRANEGELKRLAKELIERLFACLPLQELLDTVLDEGSIDELAGVIEKLSADLFDELPFADASRLIRDDRSILKELVRALPRISPGEMAGMIRSDQRIIAAVGDATSGMPVGTIIEFIQDEERAGLIGQSIAKMLLGLVADFVEDERLTDFSYDVVLGAIDALEGTPAALFFESLARFVENEDFVGYLVDSFYELTYGVSTELQHLYKQVVPRFFTQALWKFI
ncbi:MAG: hypothetical protein GYA86_05225 [Firmicutes bacterium]|nr:hypothetical protein [Bacillota bacterium]